MNDLYALLIGVDFYFEHTLPDGSHYPTLSGCVRDIRDVEVYLTDRLHIPPEHILKLTASRGSAQPIEAPEQWPTYENMVAKFQQLTMLAQAGDQVYIHYSGHGGRATTIYPSLKGENGLDEALVPLDIGDPNARYLRDVEIHYLLQVMVEKGLELTIVLDSCHSGGATRGPAVSRGIDAIDITHRPIDSLVAPLVELTIAWQTSASKATRAVKPTSSWLLEPKGYTLLAACRPSERANEYPFTRHGYNGVLTYWLLDTLRQASPSTSWKMVHDRILAKVHGQFELQTPMLQGEGNYIIFGSNKIQPYYAVPVFKVDTIHQRLQLNAGEAHGLTTGMQFTLHPQGTADFSEPNNRFALVEVADIDDVKAWAKIVEQYSQTALQEDVQAVLLQFGNLRLRRGVRVAIDDAILHQQVEAAIQEQGKGFIALAGAGEPVDFQVAINEQEEYEIWDPADTVINLRPALRLDTPNVTARVVDRLVHLAKYRNVQALDMPDPNMRRKLQIELVGNPSLASDEVAVCKSGDKVKLRITNTQTPGEMNDPRLVLNITVLDLQPDWGITQICPAGSGLFEPIDPGQHIDRELEMSLPTNYKEGVDILKVFATQSTTNFRWLEMPPLDRPTLRSKVVRARITDPLEQLLATMTDEKTSLRQARVSGASQDHYWTVAQVELRTTA